MKLKRREWLKPIQNFFERSIQFFKILSKCNPKSHFLDVFISQINPILINKNVKEFI